MAKSILPNPTCLAAFLSAACSLASCFVTTCHCHQLLSPCCRYSSLLSPQPPMVSCVPVCYSQGYPIVPHSLHSNLLDFTSELCVGATQLCMFIPLCMHTSSDLCAVFAIWFCLTHTSPSWPIPILHIGSLQPLYTY